MVFFPFHPQVDHLLVQRPALDGLALNHNPKKTAHYGPSLSKTISSAAVPSAPSLWANTRSCCSKISSAASYDERPASVSDASRTLRSPGSPAQRTSPSCSRRSTSWVMLERTHLLLLATSLSCNGWAALASASSTATLPEESETFASPDSRRAPR